MAHNAATDLFSHYFNKTLRFLSFRPRSEKEIKDYLLRHSGNPARPEHPESKILNQVQDDKTEIIELVIKKLKEQNLIDDTEFTKWWIEQRTRVKPKAMRLIKLELVQKGIEREIIDNIIHNSEFRIQNEREKAKNLIRKKLARYKNLSKQELYQKLGPFLQRRGFDFDTIKRIIDELLEEGV